MYVKLIGAILTVASCGWFGHLAVRTYKRQESYLQQLVQILAYMSWELECRMTPLPELCRRAAIQSKSALGELFVQLAQELDGQAAPEVAQCVSVVLNKNHDIPELTANALSLLGESLGQYDLSGQLKGLDAVEQYCKRELENLSYHREERLRSYQMLGLCTGAALAIIFI